MGNVGSHGDDDLITAAARMSRESVVYEDDAFWGRFVAARTDITQVFSLIQPNDVRRLRLERGRNLGTLLRKLVLHLDSVAHNFTYKDISSTQTTLWLLTRIVAVLQEDDDDGFVRHVLWSNELPARDAGRLEEGASPPAVEWEPAPTAATGGEAASSSSVGSTDAPLGRRLVHAAVALCFAPGFTVDASAHALFKLKLQEAVQKAESAANGGVGSGSSGATTATATTTTTTTTAAPTGASPSHAHGPHGVHGAHSHLSATLSNSIWPSLLWAGGVGFPGLDPTTSSRFDANRVEVLRLMLALCAKPLFAEQTVFETVQDLFLDELTSVHLPLAPTLFYSLLNTVLAYDPDGWGLPYASAVVSDTRAPVVDLGIQVLLLLLDYAPRHETSMPHIVIPTATSSSSSSSSASSPPSSSSSSSLVGVSPASAAFALAQQQQQGGAGGHALRSRNVFRLILAGLHSKGDFETLFAAILRLLTSLLSFHGAVLPFSVRRLGCHQELVVLLWKALDLNRAFAAHVLQHKQLPALLEPILFFMWTGRSQPARVGFLHVCTFVLLLLSGYRDFAVSLNRPFTGSLPTAAVDALPPMEHSSHADLLVVVLHKLIVGGHKRLGTLYSCFLTILANCAPYIKTLSMPSAVKLVALLELLSKPRFLLASPDRFRLVAQLLEVFNHILQYQFEGNAFLVYAIVRQAHVFDHLNTITLPEGPEGAAVAAAAVAAAATLDDTSASGGSGGGGASGAGASGAGGAGGAGAASGAATKQEVTTAQGEGVAPATVPATGHGASSSAATAADGAAADDHAVPDTSHATAGATGGATSGTTAVTAVTAVSPAGWVATREWVEAERRKLPLHTIFCALRYLRPRVLQFVEEMEATADDESILEMIRSETLVGVLPRPHAIVTQRHEPNEFTSFWFTTFIWGVVYIRNLEFPIFDSRRIKLFQLHVLDQ